MDDREQLIRQVSEAIHARRNRKRNDRKVEDGSAWALLRYLRNAEGEVNPTELCRAMNVTTPRITTILNDMEEKGYITRQISSQDRRRISVKLTDKGRERMDEGKKHQHDRISKIIDMIGEEDVRAYIRYLEAEEKLDAERQRDQEKPE